MERDWLDHEDSRQKEEDEGNNREPIDAGHEKLKVTIERGEIEPVKRRPGLFIRPTTSNVDIRIMIMQ